MDAVGKTECTRVCIKVDGRVIEVNVGVCKGGGARRGSAVGSSRPRGYLD